MWRLIFGPRRRIHPIELTFFAPSILFEKEKRSHTKVCDSSSDSNQLWTQLEFQKFINTTLSLTLIKKTQPQPCHPFSHGVNIGSTFLAMIFLLFSPYFRKHCYDTLE